MACTATQVHGKVWDQAEAEGHAWCIALYQLVSELMFMVLVTTELLLILFGMSIGIVLVPLMLGSHVGKNL